MSGQRDPLNCNYLSRFGDACIRPANHYGPHAYPENTPPPPQVDDSPEYLIAHTLNACRGGGCRVPHVSATKGTGRG